MWLRVFALFVTIAWVSPVKSYDISKVDVQIAVADDSETTKHVLEGLRKQFPASQVFTGSSSQVSKTKKTVYIAVGPSALRSLLAHDLDGAIISVFTSSQAYRTILESVSESRRISVTAIYAESSPADQLQLISLLYKRRVGVAVLVSEKNAYLLPALQQGAARANLELIAEPVSSEDNLNRVLDRVARAPVLLAVPDNAIYNAENIRTILVTTYRRNQAVVGFSSALVRAGALASTYSSIGDVIAQVDELIADFAASGRLPEPQFPKYFSVVVNDNVSRSLNLVVDDSVRTLSRTPGAKQ
jgi:ABC-type uncharacterized transport system substrate-binding protein